MTALDAIGAICPACGRALAEEDRKRLLDELRGRGKERGDHYRANEARAKQLLDGRAALDAEAGRVDAEIAAIQQLRRDESALAARVEKAALAAREIPAAQQALDGAAKRLAYGKDYAAAGAASAHGG